MVFVVAVSTVIIFSYLFKKTGVYAMTITTLGTAKQAGHIVLSAELNDEEKETALQKLTLNLFRGFFSIAARSIILLLIPTLLVLGLELLQIVRADAVIATLLRLDFILATIVIFVIIAKVTR